MPSRLFTESPLPPHEARAMAQRLSGLPEREAEALLQRHILPPSLRWSFCRNGKTGTTSVLSWLFEVEFGARLTAPLSREAMLNENSVAHHTVQADIFRPALQLRSGLAHLQTACRIVTVRHPATRALSSFRYLCKSGATGSEQFLPVRLRINAETGFDWDRDPGTERGLAKFLDYVEILHETADQTPAAIHWRAQVRNLRPDILPPSVIGRVEDLDRLARDVAERLNLSEIPPMGHQNTQGRAQDDLLASRELRNRIAEVYGEDYARFGYDPHDLGAP
ncbi:sulfotransferase family 2 domain-containing protein [Stagnihabitans tardus]|uniref:Sulfotransferase family 2 domain-containing protein n=1 Tax=Stagnihabitans tardus TaxID=2699202 RepID=A0AAE5BSB4_9RHOB|nr:sulfotransferase family 2 domain-containing protein [Stagnihabitans tardus]NBZ87635.1 sulfotransferase family 2 domain-containing protein [Stagnihabitans tardus]